MSATSKCPVVRSEVTRLLVNLDVHREVRRQLEESLFVALVSSRCAGAQTERDQIAGAVAIKALLYSGDKDRGIYGALKATEEMIRARGK